MLAWMGRSSCQVTHFVGGDALCPQAGRGPESLEVGGSRGIVMRGVTTGAEVEKIMLDFCSKAVGLRYETVDGETQRLVFRHMIIG